ncbi:hypothetical protein [Mesoflavibacter sp. CH_XMU1404-2]
MPKDFITEKYIKGYNDVENSIDIKIRQGFAIYSIFELPGLTYITYVR